MKDDEIRRLHNLSENADTVKERVCQRKRSLWLQGHPLSIRESRVAKRARERQRRAARRPRPLLTPIPQRLAMMKVGKLYLTTLDRMLDDGEVWALSIYAQCELILQGQIKGGCLDGGGSIGVQSPINDRHMELVSDHIRLRNRLDWQSLAILIAFTAIQNGLENALSPALYGVKFFPNARNKRMAFLNGIAQTACSWL